MDLNLLITEYEASRYLRKASDTSLQDRLEYLAQNLWSTDRDGAVVQPRSSPHRDALLQLYVQTLYEQICRNNAPINFDEATIRSEASASYVPPKLKQPITFGPDCFAKFGKREHLVPTLEQGIIRIAPAGAYADPSLNAAQKDEELEHHVRTPNERLMMRLNALDADGNEVEVVPEYGELIRYMQVPNFYVWCCGLGYDARLFHEFEADTSLVIHDKSAFASRLQKAVLAEKPAASFHHGPIVYYDPHTTRREQLTWGYSKHLRYLYQNEYRFIWETEDTDLEPFFVHLGPLTDIASLVELA